MNKVNKYLKINSSVRLGNFSCSKYRNGAAAVIYVNLFKNLCRALYNAVFILANKIQISLEKEYSPFTKSRGILNKCNL